MVDQEKVREGVRLILEGIGEDINREGLIETPDRIARMYCELAGGMDQNANCFLYLKEIVKGESYVMLSQEEVEALRKAVNFGLADLDETKEEEDK